MRRIITLGTLVVFSNVRAQDVGSPPPSDTVSLAFRWPAVTRAHVEARRYAERHGQGESDTSDVTMTYRMTAERSGSEYLISFSDFRTPDAPADTNHDAETVAMLTALMPSYRVTLSGEFSGLDSPDTVEARVREIAKSWRSDTSRGPAHVEQWREHLMSREIIAAMAAEGWNDIVGTWIDAAFEIGAEYESESVEPFPIFPGAEVLMRYRYSATRRVPCDSARAPATRDCIELRMTASPDSAGLRQLMERLINDLAQGPLEGGKMTSMSILTDVTLLARPETLLPIRITRTRRGFGTVEEAGKIDAFSNLEVRTRRFTYEK